MSEYVVHRDEPGEVSPPGGVLKTMKRVRDRSSEFSGPFAIFERGSQNKAYRRNIGDALKLYKAKIQGLDVGEVLVLAERKGKKRRVEARAVTRSVELPEQADLWPVDQKRLYEYVAGTYDGRWGGTCNCRETRQGGSLSDHACCRALDWFPTSTANGNVIYNDLLDRKKEFNIRYISWQVALHFDHLHCATGQPCTGCF